MALHLHAVPSTFSAAQFQGDGAPCRDRCRLASQPLRHVRLHGDAEPGRRHSGAYLYLYGKCPALGRKPGHLFLRCPTTDLRDEMLALLQPRVDAVTVR